MHGHIYQNTLLSNKHNVFGCTSLHHQLQNNVIVCSNKEISDAFAPITQFSVCFLPTNKH